MKILFVTQHMELGGICKSLLNLLWMLKNENITVDLMVLTGDVNRVKDMTKDLNIRNCYVCKNTHIFNRSYKDQDNLFDTLKKIIWLFKVKVLDRETVVRQVISKEKGLSGYDTAISYSNGIWTKGSHGFTGGSEFYVLDKVQAKRKIAWIHSDPRKLGITKDISICLYRKFDKIVDVSQGCKKIMDDICPENMDKSVVFYNLCNAEIIKQKAYEENPYKLAEDKFRIVTVCRIENVSKRIDRAIECSGKLRKMIGDSFIWTLVGDGPDRAYLQKLAKKNDVENLFEFVGKKDNPYPYIKNAHLYVLTSDYEAFPLTVKEALLLGTPAVITPIPPAQELIRDGENGFIVDFDTDKIAEKIKYIKDNPKVLMNLKKNLSEEKELESYESFIRLIS